MIKKGSITYFLLSLLQPFVVFLYFLSRMFVFNHFNETSITEIFLIIISFLFLSGLGLLLFGFVYKSCAKGSFFLSLCWIFFFSFMSTSSYVYEHTFLGGLSGMSFPRFSFLFFASCVILLVVVFFLLFALKNIVVLSRLLLMLFGVFLLFVCIDVVKFNMRGSKVIRMYQRTEKELLKKCENVLQKDIVKRDIYHIILDAYASQSGLQTFHNYDNSVFLQNLKDRGFYVANNSYSNYGLTQFSLPSFLNMRYFPMPIDKDYCIQMRLILTDYMIKNSVAVDLLKKWGYQYVFIPSHWASTRVDKRADVSYSYFIYTDFLASFLNTTLLRPFARRLLGYFCRKLFFDQVDSLKRSVHLKGTKYVFAHFNVPHVPYVFDREGKGVSEYFFWGGAKGWRQFEKMYVDQLVFVGNKVLEAIDYILRHSDHDPIIMLHADHGQIELRFRYVYSAMDTKRDRYKRRHGILSTFYFPEDGNKVLYNSISPVNFFRVLFNKYFGTKLDLLDDVSFGDPEGECMKLSEG